MATWFVLTGILLILMTLVGSAMSRLPLSPGFIYLLIGIAIGPAGLGLLHINPLDHPAIFLFVCEVAVVVSLFTVGLKLRVSISDRLWWLPLRLATLAMVLGIAGIALAGMFLLGLSLGGAILLGAILAPTDPVLASDVQVKHADDRDRSRFALTAEGGLNDGTAFPFVMLGLGLIGLGDLGTYGIRWIGIDLLWAVAAGLGIGWGCGFVVGRLVLYVRREFQQAVGWEEFLTLGLIALSYGLALFVHAYGFLAVLAAGLALRRIETDVAGDRRRAVKVDDAESETHPATAPAHMVKSLLGFNGQLERILELLAVIALGASLSSIEFDPRGLWIALLLFVVIRPAAVILSFAGVACTRRELRLISWFGIRGVGSLYYLMFAVEAGAPESLANTLVSVVLTAVAASIALHGISATPVMERYQGRRGRAERRGNSL